MPRPGLRHLFEPQRHGGTEFAQSRGFSWSKTLYGWGNRFGRPGQDVSHNPFRPPESVEVNVRGLALEDTRRPKLLNEIAGDPAVSHAGPVEALLKIPDSHQQQRFLLCERLFQGRFLVE